MAFDITTATSLENARKWKRDVDDKVCLRNGDNIPCLLLANKWDLIEDNPNSREVTDDEVDQFCNENNFLGWFITSAKTGLNVKQAFDSMIVKVIKNKRLCKEQGGFGNEEQYTAANVVVNVKVNPKQNVAPINKSNKCSRTCICCCCRKSALEKKILSDKRFRESVSFLKINSLDNYDNMQVIDELENDIFVDEMLFGLEEFDIQRKFDIKMFILTLFKTSIFLPLTIMYQFYYFRFDRDTLVSQLPLEFDYHNIKHRIQYDFCDSFIRQSSDFLDLGKSTILYFDFAVSEIKNSSFSFSN